MKERFKLSLTLMLALVLLLHQPLILAFSLSKPLATKSTATDVSYARSNRAKTSTSKNALLSSLLAKRPSQNLSPNNGFPGQSTTELPDGRLLKVGGLEGTDIVTRVSIQDPRTGESVEMSSELREARAWHTATTLPDGKVLIAGGVRGDGQIVRTVELFDVETRSVESLPSVGLTPRVYHTATLLTDGRVLFAGGLSSNGTTLKKVELWDYRTNTKTISKSRLITPRYDHRAVLQADGNVIFSGGANNDGRLLDKVEEYRTGSDRVVQPNVFPDMGNAGSLRVEASLPADGTTSVPIDTLIAMRFSKPLRVETVNSETVTLTSMYGQAQARIVPAERGILAFITPASLLMPGTAYTLRIAGPADGLNQSLSHQEIRFTTAGQPLAGFGPSSDEDWIPDEKNLQSAWRSERPDSPWKSLPALRAPSGVTALAGQALMLNGVPLSGVTIRIDDATARTDETGRFLLVSVSPGQHEMIIDGRSANTPGRTYGVFEAGVDVKPGQTNVLYYTIWMPKIDTSHAVSIPSSITTEIVVTTPRIPGLEVRIPPNTVIRDVDGKAATEISITPIPLDRPPFPLPSGVDVPIYFTVQPGGAYIHSYNSSGPNGARLIYPNYKNRPAGTRFDFWHYDPEELGWHVYGQGAVSEDGAKVVPDPGIAVYEFTGAMVAPPGLAPPEGPGDDCGSDGDPVDLSSGLFVCSKTDLVLPDVLPLGLTRTYRPRDTRSRAFGIGTSHSFDTFIVGTTFPYTFVDIVLPDGKRIHYDRISPGTGFEDAVYENTAGPAGFHKSRVSWNGNGYNLALSDGTVFTFREGFEAVRPGQAGLLKVQDRNGNTVNITRDSAGNVTEVTSPNGRFIDFTYDASNRITQATDNIGRTIIYTYDASGRLWKVTDPANGVTEYSYDAGHRMLTIKDPRNIVYLTNEYDTNGRVIRQTQADSTTYQFAYTLDGNGRVIQADVTDPRSNVRRVTFNSSGYVLTDTRGCCNGLAHTYEREAGTNLLLSVTDPLGRRTAYAYDALGNVTTVVRLAGTTEAVTTSFTYEPEFNQIASVTDPLNHTTQFGYDSKGNLTSVTDPLTNQTVITYNTAGQPLTVRDPLLNVTQFEYDAGDLVRVTDPLGQTITRFVDNAGRIIKMTNALGQSGRIEYDALNQPIRAINPLQGVSSFSYDPNGNRLSVTDPRNKTVSYTFDAMDRVAMRTDPLLRQKSYLYDANGNLRQVTDRKNQVTDYSYDNLDRLTIVTYWDLSTIAYHYDNVNRLTSLVDSISGTISYGYDNFDRVISETTPQGTVSYNYDAAGRRTSLTVPGQAVINYNYDDADRLTQITQGTSTVTIAYDNLSRRTSLTLPNEVVTEYRYDAASRITSNVYKKGAATLGNLTYEYDAAGRVTKLGGTFSRTGLPQAVASVSYDAVNQQTVFNGQLLTYDNNGNLTSDGSNSYTWNARDQLAAISGSGLSATFLYDANGRRVGKNINGNATALLYDGATIVQELSGAFPSANLLAAGIDELLTRTDGSGTTSPITDRLGSVVALTDSTGVVQTQYTYEPFGNTAANGATTTTQYTGRENDGTGLYYYRARYYSPSLQRFISEDPIGFDGGDLNLYAYVSNDPVNFFDPFGLERLHPQAGTWKGPVAPPLGGRKPSLDDLQSILDLAGLIPGPGEAFDLMLPSVWEEEILPGPDSHLARWSLFSAGEQQQARSRKRPARRQESQVSRFAKRTKKNLVKNGLGIQRRGETRTLPTKRLLLMEGQMS